MSSSATPAAISASPTTPAATGTARSASRSPAPSGSRTGRPNCSTCRTSTSSSPCRTRSPPSPSRTRPRSTTSCSAPRPRPCARSPPIRSIWAPRSASSPCCTPGGRTCCTIRTCIASCPAAGSRRTASSWIACRPGFFLPVRVLSRLFRRLFLHELEKAFDAGQLRFFSSLQPAAGAGGVPAPPGTGSPGRMGRLRQAALRRAAAGPRLCRALHPPRRHLQQPPARRSTTARSASAGRTTGTATATKTMTLDRRRVHPPLPAPCAAGRVPAHPLLRLPLQSPAREQARPLSRTARHAAGRSGRSGACPPPTTARCYQSLTGTSLTLCPACGNGHMLVIEVLGAGRQASMDLRYVMISAIAPAPTCRPALPRRADRSCRRYGPMRRHMPAPTKVRASGEPAFRANPIAIDRRRPPPRGPKASPPHLGNPAKPIQCP